MLRKLFQRGGIRIGFTLSEGLEPVLKSMAKYQDLPMSLADGCLMRMAELLPDHPILTLDRHFRLYRKGRNRSVQAILPE